MRGWQQLGLRALAGISALLLCAEPLARVVHLHDEADRHAWCEAHGHLVHLDGEEQVVGSEEVSETSLWAAGSKKAHGHHECPAVTALRARLAETVRLAALEPRSVEPALRATGPDARDDVLALAPKHGPPAAA
jgi:hypothetical protein